MTRARLMERIITGAPKAVMEKSAPRALRASRTSPTVANCSGISLMVSEIARLMDYTDHDWKEYVCRIPGLPASRQRW